MLIYIIGPYPPPIGGIANHVYRLAHKLVSNNYSVILYDDSHLPGITLLVKLRNFIQRKNLVEKYFDKNIEEVNYGRPKNFSSIIWKILFENRKQIKLIHHHKKNWKHRALLSLITKFNTKIKLVCTIHSLRENYEELSLLQKLYLKITIRNTQFFIVSNDEIKAKIISWGVDSSKIKIIPAFLPPVVTKIDYEAVPNDVWDFISNRSPVITANAFMIRFFKGEDLYGIDLCIEACYKLKKKFHNIGFIFCLPSINDGKYFEFLKQKLSEFQLEDHFKFVTKPIPYYQVLKKCNLFVRPTNTDGDALSIREALYYKIPAIASDVIERPNGTILFNNRELTDFISKIDEALNNANDNKVNLFNSPDNFDEIQRVYSKLTSNN